MSQETTGPEASWLEQFRAHYDLDGIPERVARRQFEKFLGDRAANRAWYLAFPENRFHEGIGKGNSPHTDLIHQIGHSRMRIEALQTGSIASYDYSQAHPEQHVYLEGLSRDQLIARFDHTVEELFYFYIEPSVLTKVINLPWGRSTTGDELLEDMMRHEAGHAIANSKHGDNLNTPRPPEMKRIWG